MSKKGKIFLGLLLLAVAVFVLMPKSKTEYGISSGTYEMVNNGESELTPIIYFDVDGSKMRFRLAADRRISMAYFGIVKLDGRVNAIADNGMGKWIFEILDNETIAFVQQGSSEFPLEDEKLLPDGAVFKYKEEK